MKNLILVLTLLVSACGGGGSSETPTPIPPSPPVASTGYLNPVNYGNIDFIIASSLEDDNVQKDTIGYDIIAVGDANMDGYDDLLIGIQRRELATTRSVQRTIKPILLLFNPTSNKFEVSQEFKNVTSKHVWPRQGAIADFDGDGRNDIFIGDHGVDGLGNNCGYLNSLVLNKSSGMTNASNLLPKVWDYTHGLIVNDFNKDGIKDLLVLNSPYITNPWNSFAKCTDNQGATPRNRSYLLAGGTFNELPLTLTAGDVDNLGYYPLNVTEDYTKEQHVGRSADLNGDGFPDLILGGSSRLTILESTGQGTFAKAQYFSIPSSYSAVACWTYFNQCDRPYSYIETIDLDGDGVLEIIATFANNNNGSWQGQYFQVLKKVDAKWTDVTDKVFPEQNKDQTISTGWCYRLQFADLNNDGKLDIVCNTLPLSFGIMEVFWIADSKGQFTPWSKQVDMSKITTVSRMHTVINTPTGKHVIGFNGYGTISIIGWKL